LSFGEYEQGLTDAGFTDVSVTPTHQVADGMHSAIVKAQKPAAGPEQTSKVELPLVEAGGCC
jgi:hypothetical protein